MHTIKNDYTIKKFQYKKGSCDGSTKKIAKKNYWDEKFNSTCFPCLLPAAYSRAVEAQTQNTQKMAIALKPCVPTEIDKKNKSR